MRYSDAGVCRNKNVGVGERRGLRIAMVRDLRICKNSHERIQHSQMISQEIVPSELAGMLRNNAGRSRSAFTAHSRRPLHNVAAPKFEWDTQLNS